MIYLDNAATSRPKPREVVQAVVEGLTTFCTNPGRSGHSLSLEAAKKVENARQSVLNFVHASSDYICVFTQGCTHALNLAILGTLQEGDHVITTVNEHNSVIRPLFELQKQNRITVSIALCNEEGLITKKEIAPLLQANTKAVIVNHVSNVNGDECDLESIGTFCKDKHLAFIVDSAQSAGHKPIDVCRQNISMLAMAGHKGLLGPQGVGCLVFHKSNAPKTIMFGGTGTSSMLLTQPVELPESLEIGTLALPNILGLGAGIKFVTENYEKINHQIAQLSHYTLDLLSSLPNMKVKTQKNSPNGVIALQTEADCVLLAQILSDDYQIYTRPGLQCAPLKHQQLGTQQSGLLRLSLSHQNTKQEINFVYQTLKKLLS